MDPLAWLAIVGLALAALALLRGVVSMARGGEDDRRDSVRLMFRRVAWQGVAAIAVLLGLLAQH